MMGKFEAVELILHLQYRWQVLLYFVADDISFCQLRCLAKSYFCFLVVAFAIWQTLLVGGFASVNTTIHYHCNDCNDGDYLRGSGHSFSSLSNSLRLRTIEHGWRRVVPNLIPLIWWLRTLLLWSVWWAVGSRVFTR